MKKKVIVTVHHELEIDIPDNLTTDEYLKGFSSFMWDVDTPEELFEHAAYCAVQGFDFAEGLGEIISLHSDKEGVRVKMANPSHEYEFSDLQ